MNMLMPGPGPAGAEWTAIADCTLPTAERPLRLADFDNLFTTALRAVQYPAGSSRARLMLAGGDDLGDRVQRLADAETACCSFFTFRLSPLPAGGAAGVRLALDIEVPAGRADVLAALVQRAEHAHRAAA